jgi:mono/diheme cytochrome c family protein
MRHQTSIVAAVLIAAALATGAGTLSAQTAPGTATSANPPAGDAKRGHDLYVAMGCYECHNYQGQAGGGRGAGARPGPNIAPAPLPYPAYVKQLRTPRGTMPPYDARLMSDRDLADVYAYLAAQPPAKDPHAIALLASVTTGAAGGAPSAVSRGAEVYAANCASCHGASGQGGAGPSLKNESARKDAAAAAAFVKNPVSPMPKLFPSVLNETDVAAVSAYVETLH